MEVKTVRRKVRWTSMPHNDHAVDEHESVS
jgi:hypothetical protein